MSQPNDDEIRKNACDLTHALQELFAGRPTASVYMAIAYALGDMEMQAKRPDRDGMLRIIGHAMDEFIAFNRQHLAAL